MIKRRGETQICYKILNYFTSWRLKQILNETWWSTSARRSLYVNNTGLIFKAASYFIRLELDFLMQI